MALSQIDYEAYDIVSHIEPLSVARQPPKNIKPMVNLGFEAGKMVGLVRFELTIACSAFGFIVSPMKRSPVDMLGY